MTGWAAKIINLLDHEGRVVGKALVDEQDFGDLNKWTWRLHRSGGYAVRGQTTSGKYGSILMHRVVAERMELRGMIDHINRQRLDNRRCNLRQSTPQQNMFNRVAQTDHPKGVYKHRRKYMAQITRSGKTICLGTFLTEVEAARAYDEAARELFGEFARLNFGAALPS